MGSSIIDNAVAAGTSVPSLPAADWDLISAIGNATNYGKLAGGAIIGLLGVILLIVAAVFIFKKLTSNQQSGNDKSWLIIVVMILIGGAMSYGGYTLIAQVASGGQKTVQELGGGFIVLKSVLWMVR